MIILPFIFLSAGVSVFILGMLMIKYTLRRSLADRIKNLLIRFTKNRLSACITGAAVTFCLQSSSASSVLTAAFSDSGVLTLYQAFFIIVGANLGTTFTGLFTAFPFFKALPVFTVIGIILLMLPERLKMTDAGIAVSGFGLMFTGMHIMGEASGEISSFTFVSDILAVSDSPFTGVLTGAFFTAVIQSSSAVTALLQVLSAQGIIGIRQVYYILLGSNIGTCATCAAASIGLRDSAKKVSLMHIFYNFAGVVIFVIIAEIIPLPEFIQSVSPENISMQTAVLNIFFNFASAVFALLLPVKPLLTANKRNKLPLKPVLSEK